MATYFFDPISGNNGNDGLSFANRKLTITSFTPAAGDVLKVISNPDPTSTGINATFTNNSPTLTLASSLTANISTCDTAWTGVVNCAATVVSTAGNFKEGTGATNLVFAAGFTTGLCAYFPTGTIDLSAYQQISFWFQPNSVTGGLAYASWQIKLCSDAAGLTPVNTFNLPAALNGGAWHQITIDNGGALGNAIQSIALYATSDPGSATVRMDNFIACKSVASADSLNLRSIIGKNNGVTGEAWYNLQSINGTTVILGGAITLTAGSANLRGYSGTTETVTLYKQEPMFMTDTGSQSQSSFCDVNASGTASSHITISGGWNRTDMSTQTGISFIAQSSNSNIGLRATSRSFVDVLNMGWVGFFQGALLTTCDNFTFTNCYAVSNFGIGIGGATSGGNHTYTNIVSNNNGNYGLIPVAADQGSGLYLYGNANANLLFNIGGNNKFTTVKALNSTNTGVEFGATSNNVIYSLTTSNNGVQAMINGSGAQYLASASVAEATVLTSSSFQRGKVSSLDHNLTAGNDIVFGDGMTFTQVSAGLWRLAITSANRRANYPVKIGGNGDPNGIKVACVAGFQATVAIQVNRSNTALVAQLVCPGGQLSGVPADVVSSTVGSAGSPETLSISFTPSVSGVLDCELRAYTTDGATSYTVDFIAPVSINQA